MSVVVDIVALWAVLVCGFITLVLLVSTSRLASERKPLASAVAAICALGFALSAVFIAQAAF